MPPAQHSTPQLQPIMPPAPVSTQPLQFYNLPKMNLPLFDGNPLDYKHWWSIVSVILSNPNINPTEKLVLLVSLLRGKAKEAVAYYDINYANYDLVVKELYERFGTPQIIFEALYKEFSNIKPKSDDIKDIANAVYAMESILKQLENNGFNINDGTWKIQFREKIPPRILQVVNLFGFDPTFSELRQRVLLVVRSQIDIPSVQHQNSQQSNTAYYSQQPNVANYAPQQHVKPLTSTAPFSPQSENSSNNVKDKACVFCGKHRNSSSCRTVKDIEERKKIATEKELCFKCLQPGHLKSSCETRKPCLTCQGNHHEAICCSAKNSSEKQSIFTVNIKNNHDTNDVAMMVKSAPICNPHRPMLERKANIFFDCGAKASFIQEDVAKQMNLPVIQEENLIIERFAEKTNSSPPMRFKKVKLLVKTLERKLVEIYAYTVKNITDVLPTIESNEKQLLKPDILIGNNYCWIFMPSKKLPNGYSEVDT
uniref:CCHC-type domain-containing protein n=1 Tax=Panagrolaimus sp. PS1159 TaxID=55785 RepID=A0AC35GBX2_9BILA